MDLFSRREFLDRSAILTAAVAAGSQTVTAAEEPEPARRGSSNDKLRVAVIGVHGRGMSHVAGFAGKNNCEVATICDCDEAVVKRAIGAVEKAQKTAPKFERDIRKVMEDKSIDIVSIATPNHWHALAAVWAMRAGKHVYCEKPATHNVHEGRLMVQASRKYKRVCQVGTQSRSLGACGPDLGSVTGKVTNRRVQLRQREAEGIGRGHVASDFSIAPITPVRAHSASARRTAPGSCRMTAR